METNLEDCFRILRAVFVVSHKTVDYYNYGPMYAPIVLNVCDIIKRSHSKLLNAYDTTIYNRTFGAFVLWMNKFKTKYKRMIIINDQRFEFE